MNKHVGVPTIRIQTINMKYKVSVLLVIAANIIIVSPNISKVVLTQFGVNQFLEYNVSMSDLREFTFCVWLRIADITRDQPILSYFDDNKSYLSVWLATGGMGIGVSIQDGYQVIAPLSWNTGKWNQVCFSWNSNVVTWALYLNLKPVWCEQELRLRRYNLPKGKRLAVGYGHTNFRQIGLEGEIFGFNMILCSTVMSNDTWLTDFYHNVEPPLRISSTPFTSSTQQSPRLEKYRLRYADPRKNLKNEVKNTKMNNAVNMKLIQTLEQTNADSSQRFHSFEMDIQDQSIPFKLVEPPIIDIPASSTKETRNHYKNNANFWELINHAGKSGKNQKSKLKGTDVVRSETIDQKITKALRKPLEVSKLNADIMLQSLPIHQSFTPFKSARVYDDIVLDNGTDTLPTLSDEVKPPPIEKSKAVYGHWADFSFTKNIMDYIKKQNLVMKSVKKNSVTDLYPYATEQFKALTVIPINHLKKGTFKNHLLNFQPVNSHNSDHKIFRRDAKQPEVNVQIIEDHSRERVLLFHALTKPTKVDIVNRGTPPMKTFQSIDFDEEQLTFNDIYPSQAEISSETINELKNNRFNTTKVNSNIYFVPNLAKQNSSQSQYESFFIQSGLGNSGVAKSEHLNSNFLGKSHTHEELKDRINTKLKKKQLANGIALAQSISKISDTNLMTNPFVAQNKIVGNAFLYKTKTKGKKNINQNATFHKIVKIGNALNEKHIIGEISEEKKKNFEDDEEIPDIQQYRSDIDNHIDSTVPPSLFSGVCKTNDHFSGVKLYIQNDGAINPSKIDSPLKKESYAILFMKAHRKSCSSKPEVLKNIYRFIDWNKSPVRIFGGAALRLQSNFCHLLEL